MSLSLVLLSLATFFTAILSGVIGMAGGVTLLSIMTFFLSVSVLIPIHGLVQLASNTSRCFYLRGSIAWPLLGRFLIGAPFGVLVAYFVISSAPDEKFFLIPISLIITYVLFKPKKIPAIRLTPWGFVGLGFVAALMAPLVGATGPLLAPFFFRDDLTKEQIIATKAATQSFTHFLKIPLFLSLAFPYFDYAGLILAMVLAAILGSKVGVMLLGHVSEAFFRRLYQLALFAALLRLIYKIWV